MTSTQEKILDVFKQNNIPKNGILSPQLIDYFSWDRLSQDEFPDAMQGLINDGFVSTKDIWYVLTEKGYNCIYKD